MQTKYDTGQAVLIPATITSAESVNGKIVYHVDADVWMGVPEESIVLNEDAESQRAMEAFAQNFYKDDRR